VSQGLSSLSSVSLPRKRPLDKSPAASSHYTPDKVPDTRGSVNPKLQKSGSGGQINNGSGRTLEKNTGTVKRIGFFFYLLFGNNIEHFSNNSCGL
jgi:hypothetical protein